MRLSVAEEPALNRQTRSSRHVSAKRLGGNIIRTYPELADPKPPGQAGHVIGCGRSAWIRGAGRGGTAEWGRTEWLWASKRSQFESLAEESYYLPVSSELG